MNHFIYFFTSSVFVYLLYLFIVLHSFASVQKNDEVKRYFPTDHFLDTLYGLIIQTALVINTAIIYSHTPLSVHNLKVCRDVLLLKYVNNKPFNQNR